MKDILLYILTNTLDTDEISVEEDDNNGFVTLTISAPQDQIGKIIGKGGKTINSIKNILKIKAIKEGKKIDIQVVENNPS